jgi:methylated-DNA-[protein]-cysteine S-methyltransferase
MKPKADLSVFTEFERAVMLTVAEIPRGRVATYGEVARAIGKEKAARAVGNALAKNPYPIVIPCHRVVKSDLSLGGYSGGVEKKRRLLEEEGVKFVKDKVSPGHVFKFCRS